MSVPVNTGTYDVSAFDRGVDPVLQILSAEQAQQLVDYQGDEQLRRKIDELAEKCGERQLSLAERAEYKGYVRANKFVAVLQAQARKFLAGSKQK